MPDIVNLTRLHLYEIKPLAAQPLGAAKAKMYLGLFARAGVAMALGPTGEPGTSGGVPAPGGVYMAPERAREGAIPARGSGVGNGFRVEDFAVARAVTTTVTGGVGIGGFGGLDIA